MQSIPLEIQTKVERIRGGVLSKKKARFFWFVGCGQILTVIGNQFSIYPVLI